MSEYEDLESVLNEFYENLEEDLDDWKEALEKDLSEENKEKEEISRIVKELEEQAEKELSIKNLKICIKALEKISLTKDWSQHIVDVTEKNMNILLDNINALGLTRDIPEEKLRLLEVIMNFIEVIANKYEYPVTTKLLKLLVQTREQIKKFLKNKKYWYRLKEKYPKLYPSKEFGDKSPSTYKRIYEDKQPFYYYYEKYYPYYKKYGKQITYSKMKEDKLKDVKQLETQSRFFKEYMDLDILKEQVTNDFEEIAVSSTEDLFYELFTGILSNRNYKTSEQYLYEEVKRLKKEVDEMPSVTLSKKEIKGKKKYSRDYEKEQEIQEELSNVAKIMVKEEGRK